MKTLNGVIIPVVTPFTQNGEICYEGILHNLRKWNSSSVCGYMFLGTNGEFKALTDEESRRIVEFSLQASSSDKTRIVGIGRESLVQTLCFMDSLMPIQSQIDYFSVLTPCYFRKQMTDEALFAFYSAIAEHSLLPILLYTAPSYANQVVISTELLRRLADHPNIVGIKDTSADMMSRYMDAVGGRNDFSVVAGSVKNLATCLERGGQSSVLSTANYLPNECSEIISLYQAGNMQTTKNAIEKINSLANCTSAPYGVSGVKACMDVMGYFGGFSRIPLLPLSAEVYAQIGRELRSANFCNRCDNTL